MDRPEPGASNLMTTWDSRPALLAGLARRGLWHRRAIAALVLVAGLASISLRAGGDEPAVEPAAAHSRHH